MYVYFLELSQVQLKCANPCIVQCKVLPSFALRVENPLPQEPRNLCDVDFECQNRKDE